MKCVRLSETELRRQITGLMRDFDVVAPAYVDGVKDYVLLTDADELALDDELPYKSPKDAVFPRTEKMFTIDENGVVRQPEAVKRTLLFAAPPCDVAALRILDAVFTGGKARFKDAYYDKRRSSLVTVGKACDSKKRGCFCDERGIDREYAQDCDAFIKKTGDGWLMQAQTAEGEALFNGEPAEPMKTGSVQEVTLELKTDENALFDAIDWGLFTTTCQGCGVCTFVCPTCHCFELRDSMENGAMTRSRVWDSCMFPRFTLHASGHNPRAGRPERFRQRVLHKFVYMRENFGVTACVGCGRCIRECPGGVSIKKAVMALKESEVCR